VEKHSPSPLPSPPRGEEMGREALSLEGRGNNKRKLLPSLDATRDYVRGEKSVSRCFHRWQILIYYISRKRDCFVTMFLAMTKRLNHQQEVIINIKSPSPFPSPSRERGK